MFYVLTSFTSLDLPLWGLSPGIEDSEDNPAVRDAWSRAWPWCGLNPRLPGRRSLPALPQVMRFTAANHTQRMTFSVLIAPIFQHLQHLDKLTTCFFERPSRNIFHGFSLGFALSSVGP